MKEILKVVENFYDNPDEVRNYGLNANYYYPYGTVKNEGVLSPWRATIPEDRYITKENVSKLEEIVGAKIDMDHFTFVDPEAKFNDYGREGGYTWPIDKGTVWNAGFHVKNKPISAWLDNGIHSHYFDAWNKCDRNGLAGVVFLTPDENSYSNNGVDLWDNILGLDYTNVEEHRGHKHVMDFVSLPLEEPGAQQPIYSINGHWKMKSRVGYKYNTLVLNSSEQYHASSPGWGTTYILF